VLRWPAIVFDLDGTLIDTIPLILASHRHAVRTVLGRDVRDDELRAGIGRPLLEQMHDFDPVRAQELHDTYRRWNHANTAEYLRPFDGIDEVLRRLRADGARLAVATSKMLDAVELAFAIQPPPVSFDAIVTLEDTERHKPDPDPILLALERMGATREDGVYVGDAPFDLRAARAAGVGAIAVTWGVASAGELSVEQPDAIAETPAELYAILTGDADGGSTAP
jgi:pyrophosphatase PpaX